MFQAKIDRLLSGIPKVFDIADGILISGFDELCGDHYETLKKVVWVCRQGDLKHKKAKCLFRCMGIPVFGEIISWQGVSPDPG